MFNIHGWFYPKHLNQSVGSQVGTGASSKKSAYELLEPSNKFE